MSVEAVLEYDEKGFTVIRKFISDPELDEIEMEIKHYLEVKAPTLTREKINKIGDVINSIHGLDLDLLPQMKKYIERPELEKLVASFLHDDAEFRLSELFLKPAKLGLPSPVHQDDFYWCVSDHNALTFWIALDKADESNGGLTYYEGSHKVGLLEHTDSFAPGSSQTIKDKHLLDKFKKVCINLERGDVLIHHALTIHGSAANESERSRRGWTLQYKAKNSPYDVQRKEHYLNRLKMQVDLREKEKAGS